MPFNSHNQVDRLSAEGGPLSQDSTTFSSLKPASQIMNGEDARMILEPTHGGEGAGHDEDESHEAMMIVNYPVSSSDHEESKSSHQTASTSIV